jgi:tetratricopeptide (TPR) repeat protein
MSGFALAAQWPGLWVLAVGGIVLNAWLVKTGRFTPMPRFLASIVTIIAFIYIADLVLHSQTTPILIIGQFLVLLQLVKLYEQRANRDYAQLIILSLLLMVAAAINTASLAFGVMFIGYLFLSLYVCLLFHLKVESEEARKAIALDPKSDRAWFQKGRAEERGGDLEAAAESLNQAIVLNPRASSYYYVIAGVFRRLDLTEESRKALEMFKRLEQEAAELDKKRRGVSAPRKDPK